MGIGIAGNPALTWIIFGVVVLAGSFAIYRAKKKEK
ncbi:LPXTG cell wall anchor domain-containing protein [Streptomyces sp. SID4919]|nr:MULTISPECIES: LPXTG cell wall anchor domain-containing protein [unclassified Streptomyces]MYY10036.1 LPXTG cell wall anchor domain-containing protein [Streptomyces sp. SID4919]